MSHLRSSSNTRRAGRLAVAITLALAASLTHAANLIEVFDHAAGNDPTIREAAANRLVTREERPQALSALLPTVEASVGWEYYEGISRQLGAANNPTSSYVAKGGTWGIELTESINIPQTIRSFQRTDYVLAQADLVYRSAEQSLAVRVAQRYFDVLYARDSLAAAEASLEAYSRQYEQAEKRFEVGLSAITDVQEARAQRDSAAATVISSKQSLTTALLLLRETTGETYTAADLSAPGDDMPLLVPEPQNAEQWVQSALSSNIDLAYSRVSLELATHDLGTYKTERYPSLTVGAYYGNSNEYANFDITGNTVNSWDKRVSVGITVPIFSGGRISSDIRKGVYSQRAARENVDSVTRQTESSARDNFLSVQSSISLVQANKQALESSRLALQATEAGFQVGTRTNIDVLNSRRSLYQAEVSYAQSRYNYLQNIIALKQTVGTLNRMDLEQINSWLVVAPAR